jgi:hypothetical protein
LWWSLNEAYASRNRKTNSPNSAFIKSAGPIAKDNRPRARFDPHAASGPPALLQRTAPDNRGLRHFYLGVPDGGRTRNIVIHSYGSEWVLYSPHPCIFQSNCATRRSYALKSLVYGHQISVRCKSHETIDSRIRPQRLAVSHPGCLTVHSLRDHAAIDAAPTVAAGPTPSACPSALHRTPTHSFCDNSPQHSEVLGCTTGCDSIVKVQQIGLNQSDTSLSTL